MLYAALEYCGGRKLRRQPVANCPNDTTRFRNYIRIFAYGIAYRAGDWSKDHVEPARARMLRARELRNRCAMPTRLALRNLEPPITVASARVGWKGNREIANIPHHPERQLPLPSGPP